MSQAWYLKIDDGDEVHTVEFYRSDKNPLEEYPERFEFPLENSVDEYSDVTRDMVDGLDEDTEYWVVDCYNALADIFPRAPDVPPSDYSRPTYFSAVPKSAVVEVMSKEPQMESDIEINTLDDVLNGDES